MGEIRGAHAADAIREFHSWRRPPDGTTRNNGSAAGFPPTAGSVHGSSLVKAHNRSIFRVNTGIGFENEQPKSIGENQYSDIKRTPWHWCCWRTELARTCPFPEHHDGAEDAYFLNQILPKVTM